ncbi:MAG TPA: hypothetical protein VFD67_11175 [Gemmatimonadaceae bacterium]|nr:hypothetical protein [Gemmatimonadaceae bacterium]
MARVNKSGRKMGRTKRQPAPKSGARGGSIPADRVRGRASAKRVEATRPVARFRVKELNAQQKCGQGTSVERLFRVDETADGSAKAHLVFLDRRHGWYCEHGVECPAVGQARRIGEADRQHIGRTNNGGMRA